ncbi:MAG TPA: branched-chain-amino-acid transaminase [Firmicutes bacterium]|nr:branched-chain-amino-acid transaminase [Bacillota bacterium]
MEIYIDGHFYPQEEAKVSVFDHGYLYGDGVFEGIRAYNGRVFKLTEHLDRLYQSAKSIMMEIPISWKEMEAAVLEAVRRNNLHDAYVRIVVSRGVGDLGLDPTKCHRPTVVVIAAKIVLYPEELYSKGLRVVTVGTRRNHPEALNPRIKSTNYLNNIIAKAEALHLGYQEVLMLNGEGYVVEGTGDNIFLVQDGKLITPPPHVGILKGITRQTVIDLAAERGIPTLQEVITRHDVFNAQECFMTGTAAEIIPVVEVDGRLIGDGMPGAVTKKLITDYRELTKVSGTPVYPQAEMAG